jgi:membrane protease YdiL (CAAX protease family)
MSEVQRSDPELRRRRLVTLAFGLLGTVLLGFALRIDPGSHWFYPATVLLAAVWTVGAFASGGLRLGRIAFPFVTPVVVGLLLAAVFVVGALLVHDLSFLHGLQGQVEKVVDYADQGSVPLLVVITTVNGVAEELFFRGAVYAAIAVNPAAWSPVVWTTVGYGVATAASGNVMLTFAAVVLGLVVGFERRASGGILAPALTHCTWSLVMLLVLPAVFS